MCQIKQMCEIIKVCKLTDFTVLFENNVYGNLDKIDLKLNTERSNS